MCYWHAVDYSNLALPHHLAAGLAELGMVPPALSKLAPTYTRIIYPLPTWWADKVITFPSPSWLHTSPEHRWAFSAARCLGWLSNACLWAWEPCVPSGVLCMGLPPASVPPTTPLYPHWTFGFPSGFHLSSALTAGTVFGAIRHLLLTSLMGCSTWYCRYWQLAGGGWVPQWKGPLRNPVFFINTDNSLIHSPNQEKNLSAGFTCDLVPPCFSHLCCLGAQAILNSLQTYIFGCWQRIYGGMYPG